MNRGRVELEAAIGRTMLPLARRWRAEADRTLSAFGLSHASGWALLHVGRLGDAVRQGDLANAIDVQGPSLVRLIDKLEADRLIERRVEPSDRRANRIYLTDAGRDLVGQIEDSLRTVRHVMLDGIDEGDLRICVRVLEQLDQRIVELARRAK